MYDEINSLGYKFIRGSETDVLERFNMAATNIIIVRLQVTIIDPKIVDSVITYFSSMMLIMHLVDHQRFMD